MKLREHVSLSILTSFHSGGIARYVCECESEEDVREAIAFAKEKQLPWYVLGEGTNVLPSDNGFEGVVVQMRIGGLSFTNLAEDVLLTGGAGVSWEEVVDAVAAKQLWGIENLAGIPGTLGAAPVQNIGAYGAELVQTFVYADVLDTRSGEVMRIEKEAAAFGYRDSIFKHNQALVILRVTLRLSATPQPRITYGDVLRAKDAGERMDTPAEIARVVRAIRAHKFPDRSVYGTAGSFFKNPVLSPEAFASLKAKYGDIPQFPHPSGVKVPLAFVLDKVLGLRGFRMNGAWLFGAQPLVLVLDAGAPSSDVENLARYIEEKVFETTQIRIEREVRTLP